MPWVKWTYPVDYREFQKYIFLNKASLPIIFGLTRREQVRWRALRREEVRLREFKDV